MPLHADDVAGAGPANGLDNAVGNGARLDLQVTPHVLDGLVVDGVDLRLCDAVVYSCHATARDEFDTMEVVLVPCSVAMHERIGDLGLEVLIERAAEGDVDELAATTYAQHRLLRGDERLEELDLVVVAHPVAAPVAVQGGLAVGFGGDVRAALQDQ